MNDPFDIARLNIKFTDYNVITKSITAFKDNDINFFPYLAYVVALFLAAATKCSAECFVIDSGNKTKLLNFSEIYQDQKLLKGSKTCRKTHS